MTTITFFDLSKVRAVFLDRRFAHMEHFLTESENSACNNTVRLSLLSQMKLCETFMLHTIGISKYLLKTDLGIMDSDYGY